MQGSADEPDVYIKIRGRAVQGFPEKAMNKLEDFGFIQSRPRGEYHANNQQMSKLLHKAIGLGNKGAAPQVRLREQCCTLLIHHIFQDYVGPAVQEASFMVHQQHPGLLLGLLAPFLCWQLFWKSRNM